MGPFITFLVIIAVIWTLSGIATAANKRKEMERRRMLQMQLQRASLQQRAPAPPPQQQPRRISSGIASRFPDVLLPPTPPQRRPHQVMPARRVATPLPKQRRAVLPQQQQRQPQRRPVKPAAAVPAPPPYQPNAPMSAPAPAAASPSAKPQSAGPQVDAAAIAKWATPSRLRQQFILTEIFQPPLALRDQSS